MLDEPTTLASVARLIGETLEAEYDIDPAPIYARLKIDRRRFFEPGARVRFATMNQLWEQAADKSGDGAFGTKVGARVKPGDFFVLGHAWLASNTLHDAFERLCRHFNVLSTIDRRMAVRRHDDRYDLEETLAVRMADPKQVAKDAGFVAFLKMCNYISATPVSPMRVALPQPEREAAFDYAEVLGCPVSFDADVERWTFAADVVEKPLTGAVPEVAHASERIAENYIASISGGEVAREVREMIVRLLPSGHVDQDTLANRLYRSRSTLQRQLSAEGTTYKKLLESTRQALAEKYLQDPRYSQAQVAFMVGFSDQSNFARAFKRWTGMSPGTFRNAA